MKNELKTKSIRQTASFKTDPAKLYELLMDSKKHSAFTEADAKISKNVGGKFEAYDGWIEGKNIKLVPNKKIVQKWRGSDWPESHFSVVTFELKRKGTGTLLVFTQKGVPVSVYRDISSGWKEHYWTKMKRYLKE
jgi:activator of HSP90 ATPase